MTTLMLVAVTPVVVAPPLSAPLGQATAHGAARVNDTLRRLVLGSHVGSARAGGVFRPAPVGAGGAATAPAATAPTFAVDRPCAALAAVVAVVARLSPAPAVAPPVGAWPLGVAAAGAWPAGAAAVDVAASGPPVVATSDFLAAPWLRVSLWCAGKTPTSATASRATTTGRSRFAVASDCCQPDFVLVSPAISPAFGVVADGSGVPRTFRTSPSSG